MTNVFVDSDVCIDLLSGRQPFAKPAEILFSLADLGKIKLHVSSLTFSNIDYVLRSQYSSSQSRLTLLKFKTLVHVLTECNSDCQKLVFKEEIDVAFFELMNAILNQVRWELTMKQKESYD